MTTDGDLEAIISPQLLKKFCVLQKNIFILKVFLNIMFSKATNKFLYWGYQNILSIFDSKQEHVTQKKKGK